MDLNVNSQDPENITANAWFTHSEGFSQNSLDWKDVGIVPEKKQCRRKGNEIKK